MLSAIVRLVLPLPPSVNDYWFVTPQGNMAPTKAAKEYKRGIAETNPQRFPLVGRVEIDRLHIFPRNANSDIDGFLKCLFDALNGFLWLDDRQVKRVVEWELFPPCAEDRVEVDARGECFASAGQLAEWRAKKEATATKRKATLRAKRVDEAKKEAANSDWKRLARPASYPARKL